MLLSLPIVFLALSVHETAHGYVAYKLGDPTAKNLGRLTLNPIKHIDPLGFICMLLCGYGWAKPVPVNTRYFKKPKRDMALTGLAGPVSNILLALIFILILRLEVFIMGIVPPETELAANVYSQLEIESRGALRYYPETLVLSAKSAVTIDNLAFYYCDGTPTPVE